MPSGCVCIRGCSELVCSFELYCIIGLTCMIAFPLLPTMSTSYCHSLHLPTSLCCSCIIDLYWLVFLNCIIALYCVFAYTPQSTVSTGLYLFSSPTCLLVLFLLQEGRSICILPLYSITCILTLTFIVDNLSAPTIVEGSRPCPHPYKYLLSWGKLVFASYCWLIVGWLWCSLCCSLILFPVSKLFSHLLFYLALQLNYYFPSPTYLVFDVACTYLNFKLFLPYPLM